MAKYQKINEWDLTPKEAVALQSQLRERVLLQPVDLNKVKLIAGADVSFNRFSPTSYAGVVVLSFPELEVVETVGVQTTTHFPYIPGLLSFREIPALVESWAQLKCEPDVLVCDAHGIAHPRRAGFASHAGLVVDRPTLGCAKTVLVGKHADPGPKRGSYAPLIHKDEVVGAALRTKTNVQPIYSSPGHLCDVESSMQILLACHAGYRIPEPTRRAHIFVNELRRSTK